MAYNFINEASSVIVSPLCYYDNIEGYTSDFSEDGNFDGWDYYNGIHTYGCWGGFLFGTFWDSIGYIGRYSVFNPVPAETHYFIKIAMKYNPASNSNASTARLSWKTLSDSSWDSDKQHDFELSSDNLWHVYNINMGGVQWWQGDINDLRLYPSIDGRENDEFFIKYIKITSTDTYRCTNYDCDYHSNYTHNCEGVGSRGVCTSISSTSGRYTTSSGTLLVDINGYGNENVELDSMTNVTGLTVSKELSNKISGLDIGGYAETEVVCNENNTISIYSGTVGTASTVVIKDCTIARELGFFDSNSNELSDRSAGTDPASGYAPRCSFLLKTHQLHDIFDTDDDSYFVFNPNIYSIEGGRRDILLNGLGMGSASTSDNGVPYRDYTTLSNEGKTIIDISNPFNASGRIKRIEAACTLRKDDGSAVTGCKFKIFRPSKDGRLRYVTELDIPEIDEDGTLQSKTQEYVTVDCDVFVNKGDYIGVYNADVYVGKQRGTEIDAIYIQIVGDTTYDVTDYIIEGQGTSGFSIYARGDQKQNRITINIDMGKRYNIDNIHIDGEVTSDYLDYNIAICKDISWQVNLFGLSHNTGWYWTENGVWVAETHPNIAYGLSKLSDGKKIVENNLAADSYSIQSGDEQPGVVPNNPYYFSCNGDGEWFEELMHVPRTKYINGFENDPIAFYIDFPYQIKKTIYKSVIYFKENQNFRSFSLSYLSDVFGVQGNTDDSRYTYIPNYTFVTLNGLKYYEGMDLYDNVSAYLFSNPCYGAPIFESSSSTRAKVLNGDQYLASTICDWTTIEHEWEPVECRGFRIYCDFHRSTKIVEMELYCRSEDIGSSFAGSVGVSFSKYEDYWTSASIIQSDQYSAEAVVADTPRYVIVDIEPITNIKLKNIVFDIDIESGYVGDKGCEYTTYAGNSRSGATNNHQIVKLKNVYGTPYDLSVDIAKESLKEKGEIFQSKMNDADSISNPVVGADAFYSKEASSYTFVGQQRNCAINCATYGLKNLTEGSTTHVSYNDGYNKQVYYIDGSYPTLSYSTLSGTESLDVENISDATYTKINIPVIKQDRYWRFTTKWNDLSLDAREIVIYDENGNVWDRDTVTWYYDSGDAVSTPLSYAAPHVHNGSVIGSYYPIVKGSFLTVDLGQSGTVKTIQITHPYEKDYNTEVDNGGIDEYTRLCVHGGSGVASYQFVDSSDYGHSLTDNVGVVSAVTGGSFSYGSMCFTGTDYLEFEESEHFNPRSSYLDGFTWIIGIDARVKFTSLPGVDEEMSFIKNIRESDGFLLWEVKIMNIAGTFWLALCMGTFVIKGVWVDPTVDVWYHVFGKGLSFGGFYGIYLDGVRLAYTYTSSKFFNGLGKVYIGTYFKGYMEEVRFTNGLSRSEASFSQIYQQYLKLDVYTSYDNTTYIAHTNISMNAEGQVYSEATYTYFYIDLGKLYMLDKIRSYGTADAYDFSLTENTDYSSDDMSNLDLVTFNTTHTDEVRWVRVSMLNGDGVDRVIRKLGVYPDTKHNIVNGHYNCTWEYLGGTVTNYGTGDNVVLNKTITSSSMYGENYNPNLAIDGFIGEELAQCWLSDTSTTQWLKIDLGSSYDIYRIKIYHGYNSSVYTYYIKNYTIQISTDDDTYTTIFTIGSNNDLERTHDLATPVSTRYILIDITSYVASSPIYLDKGGGDYGYFDGAVIREVEVYSDYGYSLINSEEWPVIATNLRHQFYIGSVSLIGEKTESTTNDWDDSASNFTFSDSILDNPNLVSFGSWGTLPNYEKWVVVKDYAATQYESGPKYLKHLLVNSSYTLNPCDYYWWWRSSLSVLTNDHMYVKEASRSLKISYPTSSGADDVSFIEGDNFGVDEFAGVRDGIGFWIHIDNINNLDTSYGYFYFGNEDTPVKYKWYISTLYDNGELATGWNRLFLKFLAYDVIDYTSSIDSTADDVRIPEVIDWKTVGMNFRGTGEAFDMRLDGFEIVKNHFRDVCYNDYGLYLTQRDVLTSYVGELVMSKGTIEFFMRPDYDSFGVGYFNDVKLRSLFVMSNIAQDFIGAFVFDGNLGVYFGNLNDNLLIFETDVSDYWEKNEVIHIAVAWSNTGTDIASDRSTIQVFVNGALQSKMFDTWDVLDSKKTNFFIGGRMPFSVAQNYGEETSSIDAVVGNLRLYNYCKTSFDDTIYNVEGMSTALLNPSNFIEISKDNLTFYKVGDLNLPLLWQQVPVNTVVPVYVRTVIPRSLTGKELRTANIIASWDVGV